MPRQVVSLLFAALLIMTTSSQAQSARDSVLAGLTQIDARVSLDRDDRISSTGGETESQSKLVMTRRLTLELRKLGIVVSTDAPNLLTCGANLLYDKGTVVFNYEITLNEPVRLARLSKVVWASTWSIDGVTMVGATNLGETLENLARNCAESFGNAWLSANPKR